MSLDSVVTFREVLHKRRSKLAGRGENTIGKLNRWVILKSNFEVSGLVFSCIETKFCKKILVGKLSPRSTQCTPLHRSLISKFSLNFIFFKKFANVFTSVAVFPPEREYQMSHFARPQNSRRVQEKARIGRPFGFTSWSNEENGDREK